MGLQSHVRALRASIQSVTWSPRPRSPVMAAPERLRSYLKVLLAALAATPVGAQQPAPAAAAPASAPSAAAATSSLSSSLGLYAFPAKNQTATQQSTDE